MTRNISSTNTIVLAIVATLVLAAFAPGPSPATADENTSGVPIPEPPRFPTGDAAAYGQALAEYADRYDRGWVDVYSRARMTLTDARGESVERDTRQTILEGDDGDKSIIRFMTPADIRGVAALIHEHPTATDDSWLYLPATRRVRRISGANRTASFQGTEFTYEDLSSLDVRRYRWRFLRQSTVGRAPVYVLEARPTYSDTGYQRLEISLHRDHWRPERIEFYDLAGAHLKTLVNSRWQHHHGRFWRPRRMVMENHQTGKSTRIEFTSQLLNLSLHPRRDGSPRSNLTSDAFTRRALESGR